jgi:hypothetical protein
MRFHEFMTVMVKQTYVWNMAGGMLGSQNMSQVASANTRRERARRRIDDAVLARAATIADERRCAAVSYGDDPARCEFHRGHGPVGPGIDNPRLSHVTARRDWDHGAPKAGAWWMDDKKEHADG